MTQRSYFGKMNSTLGSVVPLAMFIFGCQPNNAKKNIAKGITDRSFYQSIVQITTDVHRLTQPFLKSHNLSDNHLTSPKNTQPLLESDNFFSSQATSMYVVKPLLTLHYLS